MEQRRLRLGDILDDYCPRERRVTNHAVVAMIEENVKQTRCTTCDAEHAYKGARVPARRSKKESPAALYKEVLAGMPETDEAPLLAAAAAPAVASVVPVVPSAPPAALVTPDVIVAKSPMAGEAAIAPVASSLPAADAVREDIASDDVPRAAVDSESAPADEPVIEGPVHRQLIRATLPRIEGQKDARPVPDFTIRQTPTRGNGGGNGHGGFRGDRDRMRTRGAGTGNGNGNAYGHANGNRGNGGPRFQGNRGPGSGRPPMGRAGGPTSGFRGHGNGNGNGNGNKRGRGSRG
jgi:hypothetical protein